MVDFDLDKVNLKEEHELDQLVESLEALVKEYKRLRGNELSFDWNDVFQQFFSGCSANMCNNF